jgi:hypothetical protein
MDGWTDEHTHPATTHEHPHWHPTGRRGARARTWHMHEHAHPLVTHAHGLDVLQEYDWHYTEPHPHAHTRPGEQDQQDRPAA